MVNGREVRVVALPRATTRRLVNPPRPFVGKLLGRWEVETGELLVARAQLTHPRVVEWLRYNAPLGAKFHFMGAHPHDKGQLVYWWRRERFVLADQGGYLVDLADGLGVDEVDARAGSVLGDLGD